MHHVAEHGIKDNLFFAPKRPCLSDSRTGTSAQLTDVESSSVSYVATDSSTSANDLAIGPGYSFERMMECFALCVLSIMQIHVVCLGCGLPSLVLFCDKTR